MPKQKNTYMPQASHDILSPALLKSNHTALKVKKKHLLTERSTSLKQKQNSQTSSHPMYVNG